MISFGLVNQEAQAKATVDNGSYAYYSNKDNIFGEHIDDTVYATLEEEFTKVDGSMFFLPRATEGGRYYDTGIVSDKLVSEARCEVIISLNTIATDFKGLTINFGENYPVDFDVVGSTGQTIEFRGNTKSKWSTEEVLKNTTYIKLVFYKMKNPQSRLRMDDSYVIHESKEYLEELLQDIIRIAASIGITVNTRKTRICKLSEYWRFLQTQYSLTDTGRVIQKINPKRITCMRRKMKKLAHILPPKEFEDWYQSWFQNHYKIMSKQQRLNMNTLFNELKEVNANVHNHTG